VCDHREEDCESAQSIQLLHMSPAGHIAIHVHSPALRLPF
jgi:hypothetical protein